VDSALLGNILEGHQVKGPIVETVDAVVVGSGCGGAVMAKELAHAGKKVVMLERGGLYLPERGDFDQREDDMMARIDGGRGMHTSQNGQFALLYGNNVGGASVHYWADTLRTPKDRCEKWEREFGVTGHSHDELLPYFERIERDLNVHPAEDHRLNTMNLLFEAGCRKAGIATERVPQARKGCIGSGYCMQGCAYDAKRSQLVTYIPEALASGVRLFADCDVEQLLIEGGRATGVRGRFLNRATTRPTEHTVELRARVVIVAAGGFHSAPLLLKSKVPNPSGQLGKNLMANPCPQLFGLFDQDVVMWRNIPAGVGSMGFRLHRFEGDRYQEGGYLLYPNQLAPATLAAVLPGVGRAHRALMERAHQIGSAIAWIDDTESGHVTLDDDGNPEWHHTLKGLDRLTARDALKKEATVLLHAGATEVIVPDATGTRLKGLDELHKLDGVELDGGMLYAAPHPAGMARMGKDPATSVVDAFNEVHAVKGLFVCDPSVFPTAVSVDPSETIMAFSYLAAARLLQRWERYRS
jgi:choline dehydrogenase-like flavoprotein